MSAIEKPGLISPASPLAALLRGLELLLVGIGLIGICYAIGWAIG